MKLIIFVTLFVNVAFSQYNINLPEIKESNFKVIALPFHSIYITKSNTIIFDKDTINLNNLKIRLLENYLNNPYDVSSTIKGNKSIHFFIDKNVKYEFLDKVFTEVSTSLNAPSVIFRSNFNDQNKTDNIHGLKSKLPQSFYNFSAPEYLYTNEYLEKKEKKHQEDLNKGFPPIPNESIVIWKLKSVAKATYSIQQEIINEQLLNKKVECVTITNDGIEINKKIIPFDNKNEWENLIKQNDVVFIKFNDNLFFDNYTKYVKLRPANFNILNNSNSELIELSTEILDIHKKANIKLCSCIK
ncbi:biopolymer transporter ExbD [Flavobacterium sp. HNIBRBA15423]|uniref:biopolymer transporter ExbD n=1 Tax=Flavobacterium sp. HNIBRBA15423 TaxID=3458683 RepID=UPI0040442AF9